MAQPPARSEWLPGLFALRSLIRDGKATTDQGGFLPLLTLLRRQLDLSTGEWRMEEATQNISQSPFLPVPAQPLTFPPQSSASDAPISSSSPGWICSSGARSSPIESIEESLVKQEHAASVSIASRSTLACFAVVFFWGTTSVQPSPDRRGPVGSGFCSDSRTVHRTRYRGVRAIATIQRSLQSCAAAICSDTKTSATAAALSKCATRKQST